MPDILTLPQIANRALATLYNTTVLASVVSRDYDDAFAGKQGDTVNVRVPVVFQSTRFDRAQGIQLQNPGEDSFPVVLDQIADVSFPVTSEDMTLTIDDFDAQLLTPAMEAVAQQVDADLAIALVNAATQSASGAAGADYVERQAGGGTVNDDADTAHPSKAMLAARAILGRNKLPTLGRFGMWSPEAAALLLGDAWLTEADKRGDTDGLIEAAIGRKFGFDNYENNQLGTTASGAPAQADGVLFHRSAIALATRTLEKPMGKIGAQAAIANYRGLGLRVVYDYDITYKQTVVSVDFLYGVRAVRPYGAVIADIGATGVGS